MLNKGLVVARRSSVSAAEVTGRLASEPSSRDAASHRAGASPLLDAKALAQLRELDPTGANRFVERVLATFQRSAGRLEANLAEARRDDDRKTIRLVVHTLKSSSASIGALALARRCAAIEAAIVGEQGGENDGEQDGKERGDLDADLDAMTSELGATLVAIAERLGGAS